MFELFDTVTGEIVGTFPTHRKALNASNKIEPKPSIPDLKARHYSMHWRYQIRKVADNGREH
jgi:hypothetical protein